VYGAKKAIYEYVDDGLASKKIFYYPKFKDNHYDGYVRTGQSYKCSIEIVGNEYLVEVERTANGKGYWDLKGKAMTIARAVEVAQSLGREAAEFYLGRNRQLAGIEENEKMEKIGKKLLYSASKKALILCEGEKEEEYFKVKTGQNENKQGMNVVRFSAVAKDNIRVYHNEKQVRKTDEFDLVLIAVPSEGNRRIALSLHEKNGCEVVVHCSDGRHDGSLLYRKKAKGEAGESMRTEWKDLFSNQQQE
jgi:hypothetical protein